MPTVPAYEAPKVRRAPIPGVRRTAAETPTSRGAGLAEAQAGVGESIARLGAEGARLGASVATQLIARERDRADDIALLASTNSLDRWIQTRMYDPETGALAVKGKDAQPLPEAVGGEFEAKASEIAGTLNTDRQRQAFAKARADRALSLDYTLRTHVLREVQQYEASELNESVKNGVNLAVVNAADPVRVRDELVQIETNIRTHGKHLGMGPAAIEESIRGAQTDVHVGVIGSLLSQHKDKEARIYFEETESQINADKLEQVREALDVATVRGEAQRKSDAIIAAGGTLLEQREKAKAIEDPEVRDQTLQYLEHEAAIQKQENQVKDEDLMVKAGNLIDKGGSVASVPATLWVQLSPGQKTALEQYAKRKVTGTGKVETDWPTYLRLMDMAGTDPDKFVSQNLMNYLHKLGPTELKQLTELKNSIRKGDKPATEEALDAFRTNQQIVDDTLGQAKIPTTGKQADEGQIALFRRTLGERVAILQHNTGKKATNTDVQQIADDLLKTVVLEKGSWWSFLPGGASFTDVSKRVLELSLSDVPVKDRTEIEAAIRAKSQVVTPEAIVNLYVTTQRRLGNLK